MLAAAESGSSSLAVAVAAEGDSALSQAVPVVKLASRAHRAARAILKTAARRDRFNNFKRAAGEMQLGTGVFYSRATSRTSFTLRSDA